MQWQMPCRQGRLWRPYPGSRLGYHLLQHRHHHHHQQQQKQQQQQQQQQHQE
jgi:hypothetical protein